ncbi:MAG: Mu-like prophage major head subunit gpT family protein [Polyangiaceae bacterium]|nr:Mu-like prophage major head subunit gpT family protein [Polyangiaceae bacterium]
MPLYTIEQLPSSSYAAILEWDNRYDSALKAGPAPTWRSELVPTIPLGSPDTRFPISIITAKYREFEGEHRFRDIQDKTVDVKTLEYDAGYEESVLNLTTNPFAASRWSAAPSRLVAADSRKQDELVRQLLAVGTTTPCYDGANFFDTQHLANPFDPKSLTWSNYQPVAKDFTVLGDLQGEVTAMMSVPDENGDELGVDPDTILVGTARYRKVSDFLNQSLIASGPTAGVPAAVTTDNPYKGKFKPVHVPGWAGNDMLLVDSKLIAAGYEPFTCGRFEPSADLANRWFDTSSDYFKKSGKIAFTSHIWLAAVLLFPHAIRYVKGA